MSEWGEIRQWQEIKDSREITIEGVNHSETTTNPQGGKQSRLDFRFDLIDAKAMFELAKVMHEGAQHYEADNWRKISVDEHLNHALSHIFAHIAGDKQDEHLSHALCRCHMALGVSMQEPKPEDEQIEKDPPHWATCDNCHNPAIPKACENCRDTDRGIPTNFTRQGGKTNG